MAGDVPPHDTSHGAIYCLDRLTFGQFLVCGGIGCPRACGECDISSQSTEITLTRVHLETYKGLHDPRVWGPGFRELYLTRS